MTRSELLTNVRMSLQLGRRCVSKWIRDGKQHNIVCDKRIAIARCKERC